VRPDLKLDDCLPLGLLEDGRHKWALVVPMAAAPIGNGATLVALQEVGQHTIHPN
jgi:hypothetical protein